MKTRNLTVRSKCEALCNIILRIKKRTLNYNFLIGSNAVLPIVDNSRKKNYYTIPLTADLQKFNKNKIFNKFNVPQLKIKYK